MNEFNYTENAANVQVSDYTKRIVKVYAAFQTMYDELLKIEADYEEKHRLSPLTGIRNYEHKFNEFEEMLKDFVANSVKVQIENTFAKEI